MSSRPVSIYPNLDLASPTKVAELPRDQRLALFDLDGTITKPGNELLLEKFIREREIGASEVRKELKERFNKWSLERRYGNPNYTQFLTDTGNLWAKLPLGSDSPMTRNEMIEITKEWYERRGKRQVMDYAESVIEVMKENKIRPVMITGAPFEIARHFALGIGIQHLFAMESEVDENGYYTGEMKHNTGLGSTKSKICAMLKERLHQIIFAMGDTHADMVLMRTAIHLNGRHDYEGRAVMINPRAETIAGLEDWGVDYISEGKIAVIPQHTSKKEVIRNIRHLVRDILDENELDDGQIEKVF